MEPASISVIEPEPSVDILNPISLAVRHKNCGTVIFGHSAAIVDDVKDDKIVFQTAGDGQHPFAGSLPVVKPVEYGIFRKGLDNQIQH